MSENITKLDERTHQLFKILVERYIRDGQPIGSRTLSRIPGINLSPATVRNVMADLEDLGLLNAPHTSAGRIPTGKGYRLFVDTMLSIKPLKGKTLDELKKQFDPNMDAKDLVKSASNILSGITHLAGVVMLPRREGFSIRQIEFLPLSDRRVLAILVINEKDVENHIIYTDRDYSSAALQQAANYLNENFSGKKIDQVVEAMKRDLVNTRNELHESIQLIIKVADEMLKKSHDADDFIVDGQSNLIGFDGLGDIDKLKRLFEVFNKKRDILHLLDLCQKTESMRIFIGQESGYTALEDCSVVTSPYTADGELIGVLGVIGPTRMAYHKVIPIVDVTARLLGTALNISKKQ